MSNLPGGYAGKCLYVDLTAGKVSIKPLNFGDRLRRFIGGRGMGSKTLYDSVGPQTDPRGPENVLIISTGVLTGSLAPSASRAVFTGKSPLTGIFGDANIGGHFGPELKYAGFDYVVISGKAPEPLYLWIDNGNVSLQSAKDLWGKDSWETQRLLREKHKDDMIKVACIGQAGENGVAFACVMSHGHAAGRTGMGAVMGSKNLKAIAVRGSNPVPHASHELTKRAGRKFVELLRNDPYAWIQARTYGTTMWQDHAYEKASWGVNNYRQARYDGLENLTAENLRKDYIKRMCSCFNCPLGCDVYCEVNDGEFAGTKTTGPEYFAFGRFGALSGNSDIAAIIKAQDLCDRYGIDVGNTSIPFAMECFERGLITKKDTGGEDLSFGNYQAIVRTIEEIAFRKGFGAVLADGVLKAVEAIGEESRPYAMHVKGMNFNPEDPRSAIDRYYANRYLLSPRGGDHLRMQNPEFKFYGGFARGLPKTEVAQKMVWFENYNAMQDILGICRFSACTYTTWPEDIRNKCSAQVEMFNAVTGLDYSEEDLMKVGDRTNVIERLFNAREGKTNKDDVWPDRQLKEPLPDGPNKGSIADPSPIKFYYKVREYDEETGNPTPELIERLELLD